MLIGKGMRSRLHPRIGLVTASDIGVSRYSSPTPTTFTWGVVGPASACKLLGAGIQQRGHGPCTEVLSPVCQHDLLGEAPGAHGLAAEIQARRVDLDVRKASDF